MTFSDKLAELRAQNREQEAQGAQKNGAQKGQEKKGFEGDLGLVEMKGFEPSTSAVRLSSDAGSTAETCTNKRRKKAI